MKFLLDTNAVIAILNGDPHLLARLRERRPADFALSAIVFHELTFGAFKSRRIQANLDRVKALRFEILSFDAEDARAAGALRARLAAAGAPLGPYDVLIAGQALARSLIVVTHNMREFGRIEGLQAEDWQGEG